MEYYRSPYRARSPLGAFFRQTPQGTRGLIVSCAAVYLAQELVWLASGQGIAYGWLIVTLGLQPYLFLHGYIHQSVTYLFLHGGIGHIAFNMLSLWMFGSEMERYWGTRRFLTYYAVCGIGAAIATVALSPLSSIPFSQQPPTIGASGAIMGVMLAYGLTFPDRTILFYFVLPIRARYFVMLLVGMQVVFYQSYMASNVAVVAHLGGMLFGYLYLKKIWRVRGLIAEIRWRIKRRRFRVLDRNRDRGSFPFN